MRITPNYRIEIRLVRFYIPACARRMPATADQESEGCLNPDVDLLKLYRDMLSYMPSFNGVG